MISPGTPRIHNSRGTMLASFLLASTVRPAWSQSPVRRRTDPCNPAHGTMDGALHRRSRRRQMHIAASRDSRAGTAVAQTAGMRGALT